MLKVFSFANGTDWDKNHIKTVEWIISFIKHGYETIVLFYKNNVFVDPVFMYNGIVCTQVNEHKSK